MSNNADGRAFPKSNASNGMSFRAYVAARVLPHLLHHEIEGVPNPGVNSFCAVAVLYADALIAALDAPPKNEIPGRHFQK